MWTSSSPRISPALDQRRPTPVCGSLATTASTCTCSASQQDSGVDSSLYARAWRFVQRRLHLRPRAGSCPTEMEARASKTVPSVSTGSYSTHWQRVQLLRELEEAGERAQCRRQPFQRPQAIQEVGETLGAAEAPAYRSQTRRKVAQTTCSNCGQLFFRTLASAPDPSVFCSRDCQSSFQYLETLQSEQNNAIDALGAMDGWTSSSVL